jgi:aryl-alcohol dehydrogenase-like predicted oxidoreductase
VQFHWWDFAIPRYIETALELDRLRRAGKIAHIGFKNFDTPPARSRPGIVRRGDARWIAKHNDINDAA